MNLIKENTIFLNYQVISQSKYRSEKKKIIVDICIWYLTQTRREEVNGKFLSLMITATLKANKIFSN